MNKLAASFRKRKNKRIFTGQTNEPRKETQMNERPQISEVLNKVSAGIHPEMKKKLIEVLLDQMRDGNLTYRIAFPIYMDSGRTVYTIALLTKVDNKIIHCRDVIITPDVSHVFIYLGFADEKAWLKEAAKLTFVYPEQPEQPVEYVFAE